MKLLLRATFGSLDASGNLMERDVRDADAQYLAEVIDGTEIEGVCFRASLAQGLEIVMEGDGLSPCVTPNFMEKISVVRQVTHRSPEAKRTSSVLNRFLRRTNKVLNGEPCNREKRCPPNIILIREIEEIAESAGSPAPADDISG